MTDEGRREALKIFLGSVTALGVGALTVPLVGSVVNTRQSYSGSYASIEVVLCQSVDNCPEEYSVSIDELRKGPKFVLLKRGNTAIPAVFGLVKGTDGKEYPAAYNPVCTHFGCPTNASGGQYLSGFYCPCHGAVYTICNNPNGCNIEGKQYAFLEAYVSGGPAPRPLRPIKVGVKDGRVYALVAYL